MAVKRDYVLQKVKELRELLAPSGYIVPSVETTVALEALELLERVCKEGLE